MDSAALGCNFAPRVSILQMFVYGRYNSRSLINSSNVWSLADPWKANFSNNNFLHNTKLYKNSVFWIRILWIRIQIQAVAESGSYPDPDINPDQDFLMTKNLQLVYFLIKIIINVLLNPYKGRFFIFSFFWRTLLACMYLDSQYGSANPIKSGSWSETRVYVLLKNLAWP